LSRVYDRTIEECRTLLDSGQVTAVELAEALLNRIDEVEPTYKAFLTVEERGKVLEVAAECDRAIEKGESRLLTGIPFGIKDSICTNGLRTTAASKMLATYVPPYDATVIERLRAHGAIIIGKTNTDEFCMGTTTEFSAFYPTRNPWDTARVPGGSSGGSAAAIVAGECIGSLGEDTGGSIRLPSAFCGTVGLKPTYGRVPRYGVIAMASSCDQVGPISRSVRDCAITYNVISGPDPMDSTSIQDDDKVDLDRLEAGAEGMRVACVPDLAERGCSAPVRDVYMQTIDCFRDMGVEVHEVEFENIDYVVPTYYIVVPSEVSANLARYDGFRFGSEQSPDQGELWESWMRERGANLGPEVKRRILLGSFVLSHGYYDAYYRTAQKCRSLLKRDFSRIFQDADALLFPTSSDVAFEFGTKLDDPVKLYLEDIFTASANLTALPALTFPAAMTDLGLPVGLQLIGDTKAEETILRLARSFEVHTGISLQAFLAERPLPPTPQERPEQ
jgi:aspartyl-tRNA(Asn)/glutamyl-tRNA(Gln) amidotransferase subunit A